MWECKTEVVAWQVMVEARQMIGTKSLLLLLVVLVVLEAWWWCGHVGLCSLERRGLGDLCSLEQR